MRLGQGNGVSNSTSCFVRGRIQLIQKHWCMTAIWMLDLVWWSYLGYKIVVVIFILVPGSQLANSILVYQRLRGRLWISGWSRGKCSLQTPEHTTLLSVKMQSGNWNTGVREKERQREKESKRGRERELGNGWHGGRCCTVTPPAPGGKVGH